MKTTPFNQRSHAPGLRDEPGEVDDIPCVKCGGALDTGLECTECDHDNWEAVYGKPLNHLKQSKPEQEPAQQPEQEPLALTFINTRMDGCKHRVTVFPEDFQENRGDLSSILEGQNVVALYTTPPQRKPLTEEQERAKFEQWYAENAFDYENNPIGSRQCGLQWAAWKAALGIKEKNNG